MPPPDNKLTGANWELVMVSQDHLQSNWHNAFCTVYKGCPHMARKSVIKLRFWWFRTFSHPKFKRGILYSVLEEQEIFPAF